MEYKMSFQKIREKVSIIIPCYNKEKYVNESILSAINQTYDNIQIIVINDGSTDNSAKVINSVILGKENIIFFDKKENRGVVWARNFGISKAEGKYILPLDADDTINTTFVEKAIEIMEGNKKIIVSCRNVFDKNKQDAKGYIDSTKVIFGDEIFVCTSMFRKSDFELVGGYKECMNKLGCEDWELFITFAEAGYRFYKINEHLFKYRRHTENHRTTTAKNQNYLLKRKLLELHPNAFLTEENIETLFHSPDYIENLQRKRKKYRKLFNITLIIAILELVIFSTLIITKIS